MSASAFIETIMTTFKSLSDSSDGGQETEKFEDINRSFSLKFTKNLVLNEEMADFHFTFPAGQRTPVHKFLLSASSEVFRANFNGKWKGKTDTKITDVSVDAFKEFRQFFYTDDVKLTMRNVLEVLRLCKKYKMAECTTVCGTFLQNHIDDVNVLWAYEVAIECNVQNLKKCCEKIISFTTKEVFASEYFKRCRRHTLGQILEMKLNCPVADLFEACMTWVKGVSKQKILTKALIDQHLGDLFYKIPFGSMTLQEAGEIIRKYRKVFSIDEYRNILLSKDLCESQQPPVKTIPLNEEYKIECNRCLINPERIQLPIKMLNKIQTFTFSSDLPLLFASFVPSPIYDFSIVSHRDTTLKPIEEEIPTEITIIETDPTNLSDKVVLSKEKAILRYKQKILLSKFVFIRPKFIYGIQMEQTPPENAAGNGLGGYESVNIGGNNEIYFHSDQYAWAPIEKLEFFKINK